ncbi:MBL fold metallo-hydrolase [Anaerococcus porci]|uniref:MBL fold metallo-hydrolase n=1 Tax=Anaerococcus porci TaxID=2652269 RepID=UPI002A7637F1|nr:MBL fold metallo-hydrolase [Anaerococcus porci]MDY3007294.1 MBL fold metallo-hydrolase [Anaerococcus porci]
MVESKDRTRIVFHKGTHTIGGTLIEIKYKKSRIFFDLGALFNREIVINDLDDLIENNLCAYVDGLYDKNASSKDMVKDDYYYENEALFFSHIHLDHTSLINYTNPKIKVYCSKDSKKALEALSINNKFVYPFSKNQKLEGYIRNIEGVDYGDIVQIGDIEVQFIRVDHDGFGACGFIIKTFDKKISYTGDIRLHGFRRKDSENFIKHAQNSDYLITEGVSFSFNRLGEDEAEIVEAELIENIVKVIKKNKNRPILFNYYQGNFERIKKLIENLRDIRKLVFSEYNAYTIKKVLGLNLYYIKDRDYDYKLDKDLEINLDDIVKNKSSYLLQIRKDDVDLGEFFKGGIYIHTDAEPLGDYDPEYMPFMKKLEKFNIKVLIMKTSGHAPTEDINYIIEKINPKKLFTIHSKNPEWVYNDSRSRFKDRGYAPYDGEEIIL